MQRAGDPARQQRQRAVERRDRCRGRARASICRGAQHFEQMAEQAEPGHIGAGGGAVGREAGGGRGGRGCSIAAIASSTAFARRQRAHLGGEDHAGAERLGQESAGRRAAGLPCATSARSGRARSRRSRAPARRPRRCARRPARHRPASSTSSAAAQHMKQIVLDDRRAGRRQGRDRERGLGQAAHRVDVAERMVGGDAARTDTGR